MKHILLLTDFSKSSKNAMQYATQLFEQDLCTFYLLHVANALEYTTDDLMLAGNKSIYNILIKKAKHKLTKLVSVIKIENENSKHSFETIVDFDVFTDSVNQVVKTKKIDLVVMGTNGVTGAKEVIFGSNTVNIIRNVKCSTLVIPEGFKYKQSKQLFLPLDANDTMKGKDFDELMTFVKSYNLSMHVLRIKPTARKLKAEAGDINVFQHVLKDKKHQYHKVSAIPMHYVVDCYLQTNSVDMMALLVQKERFFERFFIGSTTAQISNKVIVPLLILHS